MRRDGAYDPVSRDPPPCEQCGNYHDEDDSILIARRTPSRTNPDGRILCSQCYREILAHGTPLDKREAEVYAAWESVRSHHHVAFSLGLNPQRVHTIMRRVGEKRARSHLYPGETSRIDNLTRKTVLTQAAQAEPE